MKLSIYNETNTRIPRKKIVSAFSETIRLLKKQKNQGTVELTLVTPTAIKKMNSLYRKKNEVTDVLSFEYKDNVTEQFSITGEILICPERAKKQKSKSTSLSEELITLFVHGLLHIFGFDHKTDQDFYTMNTLEKRIMKAIS